MTWAVLLSSALRNMQFSISVVSRTYLVHNQHWKKAIQKRLASGQNNDDKANKQHSAALQFPYTIVKPPLSSLLTNRYLLLLGTVFGHTKVIFCTLSAGCAGHRCTICAFNNHSSLYPVALPSSGFCKCLLFASATEFYTPFMLHLHVTLSLFIICRHKQEIKFEWLYFIMTNVG